MKKWDMKYHPVYGIGVIVKNVYRFKKTVTMKFDNKEIDPIVLPKAELQNLVLASNPNIRLTKLPTLF